ncbi:MAG: hypothetical protein ACLVB5_09235 [Christensenellales bacterium]
MVLSAGNGALAENTNSNLENGLETIQDAMNRMNGQAALTETIDDLRAGSSEDTVLPHAGRYRGGGLARYGLGTIRELFPHKDAGEDAAAGWKRDRLEYGG